MEEECQLLPKCLDSKSELSRRASHLGDINWSRAALKLQAGDKREDRWKGRLGTAMGVCEGGSVSKEFAIPSLGGTEEANSSKGAVPCVPLWERETCASNFCSMLCAKGICFPLTLDPSEEGEKQKK